MSRLLRRLAEGSAPAFLLLAVFGLTACDDGSAPPQPSRLEIEAGDAQSSVVGSALIVEPRVRVLSSDGKHVRGVTVTFQVSAGGGTVARGSAVTDARGIASAGAWTIGTRAGANTLSATVSGISAINFSATGTAGPPSALRAVSVTTQSGVVGNVVAAAPSVCVSDSHDNPVAGVLVTFNVTAGAGSVGSGGATTLADGTASAGVWTLGGLAGTQSVSASAAAIPGSSVVFNASAQAGAASKLIMKVQPPGAAANGAPFSAQPVVQVSDAFGNAVPHAGVVVTAGVSGASLVNQQATTDATGAAAFSGLALTGLVGSYSLRFSASALDAVDAGPIALAAGAASKLGIVTGPPANIVSGSVFSPQFVIEVQDVSDNLVAAGTHQVTAGLAAGGGMLSGTASVATVQGRATFANLMYTGAGPIRLRFNATSLQPAQSSDIAVEEAINCAGSLTLDLTFALGQTARYRPDVSPAPQCFQFDVARNANQLYLVMIENMPRLGGYGNALFAGPGLHDPINVTVNAGAPGGNVISSARRSVRVETPEVLPPGMTHAWDFGTGKIYEYEPVQPPGGAPKPMLVRGRDRISLQGASTAPVVGDTLIVFLEGIPRLNIQAGNQRTVVRFVSNELIFAEDVRLPTLPRGNGQFNSPLTQADMDSIARAYAAHANVQADLVFGGRYNRATEIEQPPRIVAVHTLMPSDNVWGYTYSSTNSFAWDYWVSTNGSVKGLAQHPIRNAHNLFMHEIAHTRHWGLLERADRQNLRGNRWLVEGFARFSERLPTASYLLNSADPSRTGNATMRRYPEFGNSYFRDDVPTFLNQGSPVFDGYQAASYIFDYLADHVALAGGNWRNALSQFLTFAGVEADLDATVGALLPGLTFQDLYTRARLALFMDDIGQPGLPAWTQYQQFNLRASRPAGSADAADPRNAWPRVVPGNVFAETRAILPGAAFGYQIDGGLATASARITFRFESPANAVLSVTRVR